MDDLISRQAAIDALYSQRDKSGNIWVRTAITDCVENINELPPAQPPIQQILTDDDLETLRIHMSAFKENLCNQHRWNEANEYQALVDKLILLRETQPATIICDECMTLKRSECIWHNAGATFCSFAERSRQAAINENRTN